MKKYKINLIFTERMLGTAPSSKEVYQNYVQSKAPVQEVTDDELETLDVADTGPVTVFHKEDGEPIIYNYLIKGFFKNACSILRKDPESLSSKVRAYKKIIDGMVFISPRRIKIEKDGEIDFLERPLRASTAQGERITLTKSESIPEGSTIEFEIILINEFIKDGREKLNLADLIVEWLDYGFFNGLGQWHNGGFGTFNYEIEEVE